MASSAAHDHIGSTIKELNDFPDSVKQMLLMALPNVFGSNLHQYQREAASMLRKCLEESRARAGEAQVAAGQSVKEAQTALETLKVNAESHVAAEDAARTDFNEKVAALQSAQVLVKSEEEICKEAEQAKTIAEAERQKLEEAKAQVESVKNGVFRTLLDGGWEDEEIRDVCIDGVCSYLSSEDTDAVLMAALPKALAHRPTEWGVFDKIAVDEALRVISDKVTLLTTQLADGAEKFEDAKAEHSGAWAILDLAREEVQELSEVRNGSDRALQNATVETKLAFSKVLEQETTLKALLSESGAVDAKVQQLDLALSYLAELEAGEDNKENAMAVDIESKKDISMANANAQIPITA